MRARAQIRVRLNRLRLGSLGDAKPVGDGVKELRARRMFATAAMILIPVSILAFVVFKIVVPVSGPEGGIVKEPPVVEIDGGNVPVVSYPLHASLDLSTSDGSAMEAFVRKAAFNSNLKFLPEGENVIDILNPAITDLRDW